MDIKQKVEMYRPPKDAKRLVQSTKIALLVGISGAGKDTIKKQLLKSGDFLDIVSHTTRPPRANNNIMEVDDVDYHFVDFTEAEQLVDEHKFIEAKYVHGTIYGTSLHELQSIYDAGKIAITDIDVQGVDEYKRLSSSVVAIFILPPDFTTWQQRLKTRYSSEAEFLAEWPRRRESAVRELKHALEDVPYYHFVLNDELDEAVRIVSEIAHKPDIYHRKDDEARLAARDLLQTIIEHE